MIEARQVKGLAEMTRMAADVNSVVNETHRVGGFSPVQWVIGRQPRRGGEQADDETAGLFNSLEER
eukprot:4034175-Karenia_brevis.AAC.1